MQHNMRKKTNLPSKQQVIDRIRSIEMSDDAKSIILLMVEHALFEFSMIVKQLSMALNIPKGFVEKALKELIELKLVKQQALYATERTYVLNQDFFLSLRDDNPPIRRTPQELQRLLKVVVSND